jgi:hypothetical protein
VKLRMTLLYDLAKISPSHTTCIAFLLHWMLSSTLEEKRMDEQIWNIFSQYVVFWAHAYVMSVGHLRQILGRRQIPPSDTGKFCSIPNRFRRPKAKYAKLLHSATTQKTAIFILTAVRTSSHTWPKLNHLSLSLATVKTALSYTSMA